MPELRISCLGPFQVTLDGESVTGFGTDKARALLAYLAIEADRPHRRPLQRQHLAGLLWADQPEEKALHNLRQALSALRKALHDEHSRLPFLLADRESIQLNPESDYWLDMKAFETILDASLRHYQRWSGSGRLDIRGLQQAVALYQGRFLDQLFLSGSAPFEEWAMLLREEIDRRALEAMTLLVEYHERRGEYALARQVVNRLVALAPWEETAQAQLIRLLALDRQWSAAQAQYLALRRYLDRELNVEPSPETIRLFEEIRNAAAKGAPISPHFPPARHKLLPSATPFIGREAELGELAGILADPHCRLLTLLGPGGIGKTRLALEVAREQVGLFPDGVYFVPLVSVSTGEQILPAIADALGFVFSDREDPRTQLLDYLREKNLLLVLDNFEHLLPPQDGTVLLTDILRRAPDVLLLVTSRERLNLQEEYLYPLEGLTYPSGDETRKILAVQIDEVGPAGKPFESMYTLESFSALSLFLSSARRLRRNFALDLPEGTAAIRICQLMDGLPLGVELAAAATWNHTCTEIAEKLALNLDVLTTTISNVPPRHRSLRAAFEVSWQLLTRSEQEVFRRLSVFRGGFSAEAAQQVTDASTSVLSALADQSLLRRNNQGRYDMHEAIRQYASTRLEDVPGQGAQTLARHAHYYADFLAKCNADLKGIGQTQALAAISQENENVSCAWGWLVEQRCSTAIALSVDSLYHYYDTQSRFGEGIDLLTAAANSLSGSQIQESCHSEHRRSISVERALGQVLNRLGALLERVGDYELARASLERSRAIFERLQDKEELAFCVVALSNLAHRGGAYADALQLAQAALAMYKSLADIHGEADALFFLGLVAYRLGQITEARRYLEDSLAVGRKTGNQRWLVKPLNTLADVFSHLGDYEQARVLFEESLDISRALGDQYHTGVLLNNIGTIDQELGEYDTAEIRYQQSREICREIGDRIGEAMASSNLGELACARGAYPEARKFAQEALQIGRVLQDHWMILSSLNALAETAYWERDYPTAWAYLREAVQLELESQTMQMLARTLVIAGGVLLKRGNIQLGLDILGAVLHHPACQSDFHKKGEAWLGEMGLSLPPQRALSLEDAAARILVTESHS